MKRFALGFGLLGLIGCFLPLVGGISWFDLRHFDEGWTMWLVLGAFAVPVLLGLGGEDRSFGGAIASLACFGYVNYKLCVIGTSSVDFVLHGDIGGRMMGAGAIAGAVCSIIGLLPAKSRK